MQPVSLPPAAAVPRARAVDPDFWLAAVCWAVVAWSCLQVALFGFGRDQGIYAVVGAGVLRGEMPYRDLWDFKPPGIFLVHALAQGLFGRTMLAPRLLEVAALLGVVLGFRYLALRWLGTRLPGLLGGALAALTAAELEFWHSGQPEHFGGAFTVAALVLLARESRGRVSRGVQELLVGACFGLGFLFKPPLGGGLIVAAAHGVRARRLAGEPAPAALLSVLLVGLGAAIPVLACLAWFGARGALEALRWTMLEFTPGYTRLGWHEGSSASSYLYYALQQLFFGMSSLLAFGVLAFLALRPLHQRERELGFLLAGLVAIQAAGVAMQGKFFAYHYAAAFQLVALLAGLGFHKLWRRSLGSGAAGVVGFASFTVVVAGMQLPVRDLSPGFWHRSWERTRWVLRGAPQEEREELDDRLYRVADYSLGGTRAAAAEVARRVAPGEPVYLWGFDPGLYWFADRPPASRYLYDVPQRATWGRDRARSELLADLARRPPAAFLVQHGDSFRWVTGDDLDSAAALEQFPELASWVAEHYEHVTRVDDFDIYLRVSPSPPR